MAFTFVAFFALLAVVATNGAYVGVATPLAAATVYQHVAPVATTLYKHAELDSPAQYDFSYSVHDTQTGDIKQQHEVRDGDNVQGSYSLVDADGLHRTVDYTADELNGFQATVRREPLAQQLHAVTHVAAAPVVHHQIVAAAPATHVQHYAAAPVAHVVTGHAAAVVPAVQYTQNAAHVSYQTVGTNYHY